QDPTRLSRSKDDRRVRRSPLLVRLQVSAPTPRSNSRTASSLVLRRVQWLLIAPQDIFAPPRPQESRHLARPKRPGDRKKYRLVQISRMPGELGQDRTRKFDYGKSA